MSWLDCSAACLFIYKRITFELSLFLISFPTLVTMQLQKFQAKLRDFILLLIGMEATA